MRFRERDQSSIRSYQRISLGKRKRLVELINQLGVSLSKASKKLKVKLTTARLILKKYNETGSFPMRNFRSKIKKDPKSEPQIDIKLEEEQGSLTIKEAEVEDSPYELKHQGSTFVNYQMPPFYPSLPYYQPYYWPSPFYGWPY